MSHLCNVSIGPHGGNASAQAAAHLEQQDAARGYVVVRNNGQQSSEYDKVILSRGDDQENESGGRQYDNVDAPLRFHSQDTERNRHPAANAKTNAKHNNQSGRTDTLSRIPSTESKKDQNLNASNPSIATPISSNSIHYGKQRRAAVQLFF